MGWANKLSLYCNTCAWEETFYTSKVVENKEKEDGRGRKKYEVNLRCIMSFREIGGSMNSIKTFSAVMNMTQPLQRNAYMDTNEILLGAYSKACSNSMFKAASDYISKQTASPSDSPVDCTVSIDGSWQKRGFDSQNGLVTAIICGKDVTEKCIDFEVMTKKCKSCQIWDKRKGTPEYETWYNDHQHVCRINHHGSSGGMESSGAVTVFGRSVETHNLRYKNYLGDGDSSSYAQVVASEPYGNTFVINKLECIGHMQKRVGSRLRRLVQVNKGKLLEDGKKLNGKGRLTLKAINSLQNYFGIALRQNTSTVADMKKQ